MNGSFYKDLTSQAYNIILGFVVLDDNIFLKYKPLAAQGGTPPSRTISIRKYRNLFFISYLQSKFSSSS